MSRSRRTIAGDGPSVITRARDLFRICQPIAAGTQAALAADVDQAPVLTPVVDDFVGIVKVARICDDRRECVVGDAAVLGCDLQESAGPSPCLLALGRGHGQVHTGTLLVTR